MRSLKEMIKQWLGIMPASNHTVLIKEPLSFELNAIKNRILYRGDPSEIEQIFMQIANDRVSQARFWAMRPSKGSNVRKIHSGLPSLTVNVLTDIVVGDMLEAELGNLQAVGDRTKVWQEIAEENRFNELLTKAVQDCLSVGDGAFKISFDTKLSNLPIIEFKSGEEVRYTVNRGRVQEITFLDTYEVTQGNKTSTYTLNEIYGKADGKGYVTYKLTNDSGNEVDMELIPELANLQPVSYVGDFILAVPMMIYPSPKWEGRGRSIFDLKTDNYDALDETISIWQDAVRSGRVKRYIPQSMIPYDPETGKPMPVNLLDNQYTALRTARSESNDDRIQTDQPQIDYDGLLASYVTALDLCLQGIISPSTLGIDTKKLDNAEAQREKEKTTLYTRNKIIDVLQKTLPELVDITLKAHDVLNNRVPQDTEATFDFGEYANPSFEAQVETVGKGASTQIMSIESQVDTLWGDTKDKDWRMQEVARIKAERGITELEEPDFKPHGFAPEEEMMLNGELDKPDNSDADRHGIGNIQLHEAQSSTARGRRDQGTPQVDAVAGYTAKEPEKI